MLKLCGCSRKQGGREGRVGGGSESEGESDGATNPNRERQKQTEVHTCKARPG